MLNKELADLRAKYQVERDNTILERIRQEMVVKIYLILKVQKLDLLMLLDIV